MTRRQRGFTIGIVALLFIAGESGYQLSRGRVACVVVNNSCPEPMEDLRVVCGGSSANIAHVVPGESAKIYLTGGGKQTIVLSYRQKGNSLQGFEVSGFDLADMNRSNNRLVITVRPNEFERYQEEDDSAMVSGLATRSLRWLEKSLEPR